MSFWMFAVLFSAVLLHCTATQSDSPLHDRAFAPSTLKSLALSDGQLTPPFSAIVHSYEATVESDVESVYVIASAVDAAANITVNTVLLPSSGQSQPISLEIGVTVRIYIRVVAIGSESNYTIDTTRSAAPSGVPTPAPGVAPTPAPTEAPVPAPTATDTPTVKPTVRLTYAPTFAPTSRPLVVDPFRCRAFGPGLTLTQDVDTLSHFEVWAVTSDDVPINATFSFSFDEALFESKYDGDMPGHYQVTYTTTRSYDPRNKGKLWINVTNHTGTVSSPIALSPFGIAIRPGAPSARASEAKPVPHEMTLAGRDLRVMIPLVVRDKYRNLIWKETLVNFTGFVTGVNTTVHVNATAFDLGMWQATFAVFAVGEYTIELYINGEIMGVGGRQRLVVKAPPDDEPDLSSITWISAGAGGLLLLGVICVVCSRRARANAEKTSSNIYDPLVPSGRTKLSHRAASIANQPLTDEGPYDAPQSSDLGSPDYYDDGDANDDYYPAPQ